MKKQKALFIFYLVVAIWLFNMVAGLIPIPDFMRFLNNWFVLTGGILVLISGLKYIGVGKH